MKPTPKFDLTLSAAVTLLLLSLLGCWRCCVAERDFNFNESQVPLLEPRDEPPRTHYIQDPYAVEISHCHAADNEIILSLVLKNHDWQDLSDNKREKVLEKLSKFFAIPKEFIIMESITKNEISEMEKDAIRKGNNKCHNSNRPLGRVSFVLGCGETYFSISEPITKQIAAQVKDGSLDNITGQKFGWWIIWRKHFKTRASRNRRQAYDGSGEEADDYDYGDEEEDTNDEVTEVPSTTTHAHRHHHVITPQELSENMVDNPLPSEAQANEDEHAANAIVQKPETDSNLLLLPKNGNIDEEIVESVSQLESDITKTIENTKNIKDLPVVVDDDEEDDVEAEVPVAVEIAKEELEPSNALDESLGDPQAVVNSATATTTATAIGTSATTAAPLSAVTSGGAAAKKKASQLMEDYKINDDNDDDDADVEIDADDEEGSGGTAMEHASATLQRNLNGEVSAHVDELNSNNMASASASASASHINHNDNNHVASVSVAEIIESSTSMTLAVASASTLSPAVDNNDVPISSTVANFIVNSISTADSEPAAIADSQANSTNANPLSSQTTNNAKAAESSVSISPQSSQSSSSSLALTPSQQNNNSVTLTSSLSSASSSSSSSPMSPSTSTTVTPATTTSASTTTLPTKPPPHEHPHQTSETSNENLKPEEMINGLSTTARPDSYNITTIITTYNNNNIWTTPITTTVTTPQININEGISTTAMTTEIATPQSVEHVNHTSKKEDNETNTAVPPSVNQNTTHSAPDVMDVYGAAAPSSPSVWTSSSTSPTSAGTTPSSSPTADGTSPTTSTSSDYPEAKMENQPPLIRTRLQKLAVTSGKSFTFIVPSDTFYDAEDHNNLRLELTDKDGHELKPSSWLQFNAETREIYGLPLDDAVSKWQYLLSATDSGNESVTETLELSVQQHRGVRSVNHEINIAVKINEKNMPQIDWQLKLMRAIATTLDDDNTNAIVVREIHQNPQSPNTATFVYFNETLPTTECPDLNDLINRLKPERLTDLVYPILGIKSITGELIGPCRKTQLTKPKPTINLASNVPPMPRNQVDRVNATAGQLLVYKVPGDTFYDPDNEPLKLTLKTKDHKELNPRQWLQFDSKNEEFYGIPKAGDLGSEEYLLVAEDSAGQTATDALVVVVNHAPKKEFSVYFKAYLGIRHEQFTSDLQRKFVERIAQLFGDSTTEYVQIRSVTPYHDHDATIVNFYNTTLYKSHNRCPEEESEAVRSVYFIRDHLLRDNVKKVLGPELNLTNMQSMPLGMCQSQIEVPRHDFVPTKTDEPLLKSTFSEEYMYTVILPAVIIAVMIIVGLSIACCLHRRRRKSGKMELGDEEERKSFRTKGIPVIFQDELDEKPEIGNKSPIILKDEKPPLLPPSYNTSNMNGDTDVDEYVPPPAVVMGGREARGKSPATPSYRKPPPYVSP